MTAARKPPLPVSLNISGNALEDFPRITPALQCSSTPAASEPGVLDDFFLQFLAEVAETVAVAGDTDDELDANSFVARTARRKPNHPR